MKESSFKYTSPVLTLLEFKVNDPQELSKPLQLENHFRVDVLRDEDMAEATVFLSLSIGKGERVPFELVAEASADFSWEDSSFTQDQLETLLTKNAPALLVAFLRPIVASVTNFSPFPVYNLPFFDMR